MSLMADVRPSTDKPEHPLESWADSVDEASTTCRPRAMITVVRSRPRPCPSLPPSTGRPTASATHHVAAVIRCAACDLQTEAGGRRRQGSSAPSISGGRWRAPANGCAPTLRPGRNGRTLVASRDVVEFVLNTVRVSARS